MGQGAPGNKDSQSQSKVCIHNGCSKVGHASRNAICDQSPYSGPRGIMLEALRRPAARYVTKTEALVPANRPTDFTPSDKPNKIHQHPWRFPRHLLVGRRCAAPVNGSTAISSGSRSSANTLRSNGKPTKCPANRAANQQLWCVPPFLCDYDRDP